MTMLPLQEPVLDDDYPVHADYWYVADGKPVRSDVFGTVRDLKRDLGANEIRACDLVARCAKAKGETP